MLQTISPYNFTDYELIDSGRYYKLERFGKYILSRPEPQAIWDRTLSDEDWERIANAKFVLKKGSSEKHERGEWILKKGMPNQWYISYKYKEMEIKMRLGLTAFKHVGVFPEQADNWNYLYDTVKELNNDKISVINLFAYTGGASLSLKSAGANVTHLDSVRQVVNWAKENMEASKLKDIRWIVDDAVKFIKREVNRGNKYNGIILDPPAYGRGPEGEKWILETDLNELLKMCAKIIIPEKSFVLLNLYSMGYSAHIAENLLKSVFNFAKNIEKGELVVCDRSARQLPLGVFARFKNFIS